MLNAFEKDLNASADTTVQGAQWFQTIELQADHGLEAWILTTTFLTLTYTYLGIF